MKITYKGCNASNYRKGRTTTIQWIVLHYTGNNGDTAAGNAAYFAREENLRASAHYFVDENEIYQSVSDEDTAWHCGSETGAYFNACRNANSIGIEMCSDKKNGKYVITDATAQRAAELVRYLMGRYNVPLARVCRHYDVTHKDCPEPWVRNEKTWTEFKEGLTDMTEAQVKSIAMKALSEVIKPQTVYNGVDECPAWAKETVQKLLNKGFLQGDADGKLNLTYDLLRVLVINDRAHIYG